MRRNGRREIPAIYGKKFDPGIARAWRHADVCYVYGEGSRNECQPYAPHDMALALILYLIIFKVFAWVRRGISVPAGATKGPEFRRALSRKVILA